MLKLELGCGMSPTPGYVHHDRIQHAPHVDLAWDLRKYPWPFATSGDSLGIESKGKQKPPSAFLDEILALDVFEHVSIEIEPWLNECWRLLKPGGLLDIRLPSWDNELSYRDPTHLRVYHQQTMDYWDRRSPLWTGFGSFYFAEAAQWW